MAQKAKGSNPFTHPTFWPHGVTWLTHHPFKVESTGSRPVGVTKPQNFVLRLCYFKICNKYWGNMKNLTDFEKIIAKNDEYFTDSSKIKKLLLPSFFFYTNIIRVIHYSNKLAVNNVYNGFQWVGSSLDLLDSFEKSGVKFHFTGMSNIKKFDGPAVFIGNHMSTMETLILPAIIHPIKKVCFVVKKELTTYPLFGPVNNARYPIIVGRTNPREDLKLVMEEGAARLKSGRSIIIFPQKTRSFGFDAKSFNTLGIKLAKQNNVPVVPMAILTDAWKNGKIIKEFGKIDTSRQVEVAFGQPLSITGNGSEQHRMILDFIKQKLIEWGRKEYILLNK